MPTMGMAIISATSVPRHSVPSPSRAAILRRPSSVPRYTGAAVAAVAVQPGPQAASGSCGGAGARKQSQAANDHFLRQQHRRAQGNGKSQQDDVEGRARVNVRVSVSYETGACHMM
jgi:hypothetical protein